MKKLIKTLFAVFALLPFVATTALAAPAQKSASKQTQTVKSAKKTDKKSTAKKAATKKTVDKKATKKTVETKKTAVKSDKNATQKQPTSTKKSNKSQTQKNAKKEVNKGAKKAVKNVEKGKKAQSTKVANKNSKKVEKVQQVEKTEKVAKSESSATKTAPLSQAKKLVVVPKCQDRQVFNVLSDAFKQQGKATGAQMTVKQISQARETQHYPEQGIRSCHALVETNGKKYQTDYSVILNGSGFFVQVENAQAMF